MAGGHQVSILVAPLLLLLLDLDSPGAFQEADDARFDDLLAVPGVAAHAAVPCGIRVVVCRDIPGFQHEQTTIMGGRFCNFDKKEWIGE